MKEKKNRTWDKMKQIKKKNKKKFNFLMNKKKRSCELRKKLNKNK